MAQKFDQKIKVQADDAVTAMQIKNALEQISENISADNIFMLAQASKRPDINTLLEQAKQFLQ